MVIVKLLKDYILPDVHVTDTVEGVGGTDLTATADTHLGIIENPDTDIKDLNFAAITTLNGVTASIQTHLNKIDLRDENTFKDAMRARTNVHFGDDGPKFSDETFKTVEQAQNIAIQHAYIQGKKQLDYINQQLPGLRYVNDVGVQTKTYVTTFFEDRLTINLDDPDHTLTVKGYRKLNDASLILCMDAYIAEYSFHINAQPSERDTANELMWRSFIEREINVTIEDVDGFGGIVMDSNRFDTLCRLRKVVCEKTGEIFDSFKNQSQEK